MKGTYKVVWKWYNNGQEFSRVCEMGLSEAEARTLCQQLNMLASQYNQSDVYYVEAE